MDWQTPLLIIVALVALESRFRIARLQAQVDATAGRAGLLGNDPKPSAEVAAKAMQGETIEAIRLYRRQSGADLRTAKRVVEDLSRGTSAS